MPRPHTGHMVALALAVWLASGPGSPLLAQEGPSPYDPLPELPSLEGVLPEGGSYTDAGSSWLLPSSSEQGTIQQGTADWVRMHGEVLAEIRRLSATGRDEDLARALELRAELIHAVAQPVLHELGLDTGQLQDPQVLQGVLQGLLQQLSTERAGGPAGLTAPPAGRPPTRRGDAPWR